MGEGVPRRRPPRPARAGAPPARRAPGVGERRADGEALLLGGHSVVVDATNTTGRQRAPWLSIAGGRVPRA